MSASISLDELNQAGLTPEEQAAINDPEYSEAELAAMKAVAGAPDDDGDDDDGDDGDSDAPPAEGKAAEDKPADDKPAADQAAATEAGDESKPDQETAEPLRPVYQAQLPQDFKDQQMLLTGQLNALAQKFRDGDIEIEEYQNAQTELLSRRDALNAARIKAEIASEMTQQTAQQQWENTINRFMAQAAKDEGIDYRKDTARAADLDQFVKVLASRAENDSKPMEWFLQEAHRRVRALHGDVAAPAPAPAAKKEAPSRKPPLDAVPKSLAQVPGGDGPGDLGGEFAHLDALDGNELEAALAKMTATQREKFAMGL